MSYTTIKNRSKTPEKFGTGIMDGVVASETANNAAVGGAMIPLLTLGIPGDGITAILLGSLIIHGIAPGPLIFDKSGALMYAIYLIIGLSSLFMLLFMLFGIKGFVKVLSAPQNLLMPIILCMCCVGAFGCSNRMFDVWCLLYFGLIAVVIRAMKLPIMPVAIGFILGPIFEKNLRRAESFMSSGPKELLNHPLALVILVVTVAMIVYSLRSNKRAADREAAAVEAVEASEGE
jgi:putative tricarboxylic transport membrane protein